jgi:hypothetical protein
MLNFTIYKIRLKFPFRTSTIDYERSRVGVLRCLRASSALESRELGRTLILHHNKVLCTSDCDTVSYVVALDRVFGNTSAVYDRFGIICPASHTNVDSALDVGAKRGDSVMMYPGTSIIAIPWIYIDQIDTYHEIRALGMLRRGVDPLTYRP